MKKHFLALIALSGFSALASAQQTTTWQPLTKTSFAEVNFKYENCRIPEEGINQEIVLLQFKNLTKNTITLVWDQELHYGTQCYNCDGKNREMHQQITLKPNEIVEGTCGIENERRLKIFSKNNDIKGPSLSLFKLNNLQIAY